MLIFPSNITGVKDLIVVDDDYQHGTMVQLKNSLESMQEILNSTFITLEEIANPSNKILVASVAEKLTILTQEAKVLFDEQLCELATNIEEQAQKYIQNIEDADLNYYNSEG